MANKTLFSKYDLWQTIENHKGGVKKEIDGLSDERLLATDLDELSEYFMGKFAIDLPRLGEPTVAQKRIKIQVSRYGGYSQYGDRDTVEVDAEQFTLEVPYVGDGDLFFHRGSRWSTMMPHGDVRARQNILAYEYEMREPDSDKLNKKFESFLNNVNEYLGHLERDIDNFNLSIPSMVEAEVKRRRMRSDKVSDVASGLKFKLKSRTQASALSLPVTRKKFPSSLPAPKKTSDPEPFLSTRKYNEILKIIKDMSVVMERSPDAFKTMDEETLRFQILVPLNGQFEGNARGEVFNHKGKTDILITDQGRNIFVAECKFWRGEKSLADTIDQILGYLTWRDTKASIILFNRNKNFTEVLAKIPKVVSGHSSFVKEVLEQNTDTEFRYLLRHRDDAEREITLTVLAFDVPRED